MKKIILYSIGTILVVIQFFHPTKNVSDDRKHDISIKYILPSDVSGLLKKACYNCHSNKTSYPWYFNVQPAAWWMANHINEAKQGLNFSDFTSRKIAIQNKKFEEIIEMVEEKKMPLPSYTWFGFHPEARLTDPQRQLIINWATAQMDTLKTHFPADSLKLPRRQGPPPK